SDAEGGLRRGVIAWGGKPRLHGSRCSPIRPRTRRDVRSPLHCHRSARAEAGTAMSRDFKVFSGNSNPKLARDICAHLGRPLSAASVDRFSDGETSVEIGENVRGVECFVVQSTCTPTNDHLMELLVM